MKELLLAIIFFAVWKISGEWWYIKSKWREYKLKKNAKQTKLQQQNKGDVQNPA